MKRLFLLVCLFIAALAVPAAAQAPRVIVRGAHPLYVEPTPFSDYSGGGYYGSPQYLYGDPLDRYYDPAGKIPDYRYFGPPAVDLILARSLTRNNESLLQHMLRCQRTYPTYNPATNFFVGPNGIPQPCYR